MKTVKLILKLLVSYIVFLAVVFGIYWLCNILPVGSSNDIIYQVVICAIIYMIPALLPLGYSLLIYAILKNSSLRFLKALLNGVAMTALSVGAILLLVSEFGQNIQGTAMGILQMVALQGPAICVLSIIMPLVLLALRPRSLPQAEAAPETIPDAVPVTAEETAEESK